MTDMTTEKQIHDALRIAATSCPHEIDHDRVILHFDPKQPGHNALNQLGRRLAGAQAQQEPTGDAKAVLAALVSAQCNLAPSRPPGSSDPDSVGYDHDAFMWDYYQRAIEAARRLCAAPPVQQAGKKDAT